MVVIRLNSTPFAIGIHGPSKTSLFILLKLRIVRVALIFHMCTEDLERGWPQGFGDLTLDYIEH
jgi:hypothetical protein